MITIDGKEYNKEEMSNEQVAIVGKLLNLKKK
jgi:hypothetical protein